MGCDIHPYAEVRRNGRWVAAGELPDDRDYRTFAVLADVCNYSTDPPIMPISPPRGLPADIATHDEPLDDDGNGVWLGDHSFSWLMLAELEKIDTAQTVTLSGMVSPEAAKAYREHGTLPDHWCQATNQVGCERLTWPRQLSDVTNLLPRLIEAMRALGPPDDVRMVFGFDN